MTDFVSLQGPVELLDDKLVLRIPLEVGGAELQAAARGISTVKDGCLEVTIPDWLAEKLGIGAESRLAVDNRDGKFNLTAVPDGPQPSVMARSSIRDCPGT